MATRTSASTGADPFLPYGVDFTRLPPIVSKVGLIAFAIFTTLLGIGLVVGGGILLATGIGAHPGRLLIGGGVSLIVAAIGMGYTIYNYNDSQ